MLIDLFQKTRTTSMQMKSASTLPEEKPQIVCKACGTHLQARNYGRNLYVCPSCGHYARLLARHAYPHYRGQGFFLRAVFQYPVPAIRWILRDTARSWKPFRKRPA